MGGVRAVGRQESKADTAVSDDFVVQVVLSFLDDTGQDSVDLLRDGLWDSFTFLSKDISKCLRNLDLLFSVDLVSIKLRCKLLNNWISLWSHSCEKDEVANNNLPYGLV